MTPTRRRQINELAEKLRDALGMASPLDMKAVAERLGGNVKYAKPPALPYEALIEKKSESFLITLASDRPRQRRNFSIAHELGHLFLHMGYIINPKKWDGITSYEDSVWARHGYTEEELEANEFAGALLMPRVEFATIADASHVEDRYNLAKIAVTFDVSPLAAKTRGQWLGIFPWE